MSKSKVVQLFDSEEFVVVVDGGRLAFLQLFSERVKETAPARRWSQVRYIISQHLLVFVSHEHHAAVGHQT